MHRIAKIATPLLAAGLMAGSLLSLAATTTLDDGTVVEHGPFLGEQMPALCEAEMPATLADGTENPDYWYAQSRDDSAPEPDARCHHMATDMNGLDDPIIDVLIVPPASPAAERDLRITRQSIEMWDAGIDVVAQQLGMQWLAEGVEFRVAIGGAEYGDTDVNPAAFVDPEIVVVVSNPVGGLGIGIDPADFVGFDVPCSPVPNPLSYEAWAALDGFDSHHDTRSGTYVARAGECGDNIGGNVCFAVNGAIDPTPGEGPLEDFFSLYDLVSHEVGHCLTIGHVGDGAEGSWAKVAPDDIMAYDSAPVNANKCVSTLNVVGFATVMARYLDVDGDGEAGTDKDQAMIRPNDPVTDDGRPFVVHRPSDQFYASESGWPWDCPQPDLGLLPGERTDFRVTPLWSPLDADAREDFDEARFRWQVTGGRG